MTNIKKANVFRTLALLLGFSLLGMTTHALAEGSIEAGTTKARACQVCHGKGGHSTNPSYPILAGQHAAYIQKQLRAFRAGTRKDPIMNGMAAPLSDQDIEDVAAFFQSNR
jgi:cytochrome c553